jgi:hypothetical protein
LGHAQKINTFINNKYIKTNMNEEYYNTLKKYTQEARARNISDAVIFSKMKEKGVPDEIIKKLILPDPEQDSEKKHNRREALIKIYVEEMRKRKFSDAVIIEQLKKKNIPDQIISQIIATQTNTAEYDRDKDVITAEESENLEQKENKRLLNFKKKNKQEESKKEEEELNTYTVEQISKEIYHLQKEIDDENVQEGKVEGKVDLINEKIKDISIELENFGEKIGELRSTVLGRERMFNKLEEDFNTVKYVVNTFKPETINVRFSNQEAKIIKIDAQTEKNNELLKVNTAKLKEYSEIMSSIKSYKHLIAKLNELQKTQKEIDNSRMEIEKINTKTEAMVENIEESIARINEINTIAQNNQSNIRDIMISLSKIEANLESSVKKEDFEKIKSDVLMIKKAFYYKK